MLDLDVQAAARSPDYPLPAAAGVREPAARRSGDGGADRRACARRTRAKLAETLAVTEGLLYRRGNFNGTFDQLILDALMAEKDAEIAFSPGFRWGTTLLPGRGDHAAST